MLLSRSISTRCCPKAKREPAERSALLRVLRAQKHVPMEPLGVDEVAVDKTLVVGRPNVLDAKGFVEDVEAILSSRLLTNCGPFMIQLEESVREYLGATHVVAVANATVGLELALRALDLAPGKEVLVPSFTFVATAHAVRTAGLRPVFVDVDATTHFVDLESARSRVTSSTVAVIGVHLWGSAGDAAGLEALAAELGLAVVYDSAHAFGARYDDGKRVGCRGDAEVFSLHATKLLNTFEAGSQKGECVSPLSREAPL